MLYVSYTLKRSCSSQKSVCYVSLKIRYRNYDSLPNARANYKRVMLCLELFHYRDKVQYMFYQMCKFYLAMAPHGPVFSRYFPLPFHRHFELVFCHDVIVQIKSHDFTVGGMTGLGFVKFHGFVSKRHCAHTNEGDWWESHF